MTREEAIQAACSITSLAFHSIRDYSKASDGFCDVCRRYRELDGLGNYQNQGETLAYVRLAVLNALKRDGYKISPIFDPDTGKEFKPIVVS